MSTKEIKDRLMRYYLITQNLVKEAYPNEVRDLVQTIVLDCGALLIAFDKQGITSVNYDNVEAQILGPKGSEEKVTHGEH